MSKTLIVANWKMNLSPSEALKKTKAFYTYILKHPKKIEVVLCPDFLSLQGILFFLKEKRTSLTIGAQDCFYENTGPFTGEVSPYQLKELGCTYVIVGHSERRIHLQESSELISRKIQQALRGNLIPIVCVGEHIKMSQKQSETFLEKQLLGSLENIVLHARQSLIIAYEPVWAIGTGTSYKASCSPEELTQKISLIKKCMKKRFGSHQEKSFSYLYGGSVTSQTAYDFIHQGNVDGLLVGTASLDQKEFLGIINAV